MITAFLNFARPQPLQVEDVNLDELIYECARELKPAFEERRVELIIDIASGLQTRADPRMLRQAVLNLMRNAVEAIPGAADKRRVKVRGETEKDRVTLSIQDTGPGIATADLQRVFIPFFTTKPSGHGVGLALAHRIITEHGATLSVANAPEGGAIFTIQLLV
jgi:signal transduction histidine kinase